MAVTPVAGVNSQVTTGGTSVIAANGGQNGGVITNPLLAADQNIGSAEVLWINPVGAAGTAANNTTFALQPGQSWTLIPGQSTATWVNATTSGHKFSVVVY
jgi:hypothetical protein